MASQEIKLSDLTVSLQKIGLGLKKHAGIIIVVVASSALVYSISNVNFVLSAASDETYRAKQESAMTSMQFDKATIEKIQALKNRETSPAPSLPGGRINPFKE